MYKQYTWVKYQDIIENITVYHDTKFLRIPIHTDMLYSDINSTEKLL